ncbi:MAG TPA: DUF2339 domain-containing protein [Burkholderiales bacterium]|nr:DUF2339 domain-containing protein [Burkholderiales bacterium]
MVIVFAILGLIMGAGIGEGWGALIGALAGGWLGYWLKKSKKTPPQSFEASVASVAATDDAADLADPKMLHAQVRNLMHRVLTLEKEVAKLKGEEVVAAAEARMGSAVAAPAALATPVEQIPQPAFEPVAEVQPAATFATPEAAAAAEPVVPKEPGAIWKWLTGGNALVRIGVVILFFGVAFLVRYAAEHVEVPIEGRLAGAALGALLMLVIGWRLRERAGGYGLVLQGGGIGVLYLVVFGAFRIWKLVPSELAFALLVLIALASAILAIAQDSRSLAVAGVSGGFLAPLLASTGQGSHVALFGFYLVLDIGVLIIAWYKAWRALNLVAFAFTFVIGGIWGGQFYRPEFFSTTQPFLAAFFVLYVAVAVLYALRRAPQRNDAVDNILVFGNPLVAAGLQFGLVKDMEYGAAWSAVALGAFYAVLAWQLWRRQRESLQLLVECFIALSIAFATLAIPLAFDGRWTAASWALEGAAALWVGTRQNRKLPKWLGLALQPAAGFAFLADAPGYVPALAVLNSGFVGGMTIALSGFFCAWYLARTETGKALAIVPAVLFAWATAWWLGTGWYEIGLFVRSDWTAGVRLLDAALTSVVFLLSRRPLAWRMPAYGALVLLPVMVIWTLLWHEAHSHPFAGSGLVAWPVAFAVLYWALARVEGEVHEALSNASHCIALWLLSIVLGWECAWRIDAAVGEGKIWADIGRPLVPALLAAWITTRSETSRWPFATHLRLYLVYALAPLMAALWLWGIGINFAQSGDPAPLPYLPLLNPLDVSIALLVLILLTWRRTVLRVDPPAWLERAMQTAPVWLGASGFLWANGVLLRTLHHWANVPFRFEAMMRSTLVQTSFSVFWSLLALGAMVFANRIRMRGLWVCGAGLLAVVVVKLFLIDLSKIGGVERIVSFLGVGVLLLVIGYLAPVPPRKEGEVR